MIVFAIPGDLSSRSGGYGYDRRLLAELPGLGLETRHLPLPGRFPDASGDDIAAAVTAMNTRGDVLLIDGLAYGAMPLAAVQALRAPVVALCHHPLCLEAGRGPLRAAQLRETERAALAQAAHVIVTSAHTGGLLARDFAVAADRISVAAPGTDPAPRARGSGGAPALLAVGAIIQRKAFDVLVEALSGLIDLDWRLRIIGDKDVAPATTTALERLIAANNLSGRVELSGDVSDDELGAAYDASDVFVSSSLYEGYGMALAEAMARGLPIVATTGGAAGDTAQPALKIPPGDVAGLRVALRCILTDRDLRAARGEASWRAGRSLPRWRETAAIVAAALRHVKGSV